MRKLRHREINLLRIPQLVSGGRGLKPDSPTPEYINHYTSGSSPQFITICLPSCYTTSFLKRMSRVLDLGLLSEIVIKFFQISWPSPPSPFHGFQNKASLICQWRPGIKWLADMVLGSISTNGQRADSLGTCFSQVGRIHTIHYPSVSLIFLYLAQNLQGVFWILFYLSWKMNASKQPAPAFSLPLDSCGCLHQHDLKLQQGLAPLSSWFAPSAIMVPLTQTREKIVITLNLQIHADSILWYSRNFLSFFPSPAGFAQHLSIHFVPPQVPLYLTSCSQIHGFIESMLNLFIESMLRDEYF